MGSVYGFAVELVKKPYSNCVGMVAMVTLIMFGFIVAYICTQGHVYSVVMIL